MVGSHPNGPPHQHAKGYSRINGKERRQKLRNGQIELDFRERKGINPNTVVYFVKANKINARSLLHIVIEEMPHFAEYCGALQDLRSEERLTDFIDWHAKTEHNNDLVYYRGKVNELERLCQKSKLSKLLFELMYTKDFEPSEFHKILLEHAKENPTNKPLTVFLYSLKKYVDYLVALGKDSEKLQISELIREMQKRD